jgi:hypothetical protein
MRQPRSAGIGSLGAITDHEDMAARRRASTDYGRALGRDEAPDKGD